MTQSPPKIQLSGVSFSVNGRGEIGVPSLEIDWDGEARLTFQVGHNTLAALIEDGAFGLDSAPPGTLESLDRALPMRLSVTPTPRTLSRLGDPTDTEALALSLFDADPALWSTRGFVAREIAQTIVEGEVLWKIPIHSTPNGS